MQETHLITDASCFETIYAPDQPDCILSIGACIIRGAVNKGTEIFNKKRVFLFPAQSSAQAELLIGINALRILNDELPKCNVKWFCDLPYLPTLIKGHLASADEPKGPLSEELGALTEIMKIIDIEIGTPNTSQLKHYHSLCHRACTMLRPTVIESANKISHDTRDSNNFYKEVEAHLNSFLTNKNSQWAIISRNGS